MLSTVKCSICDKLKVTASKSAFRCCNVQQDVKSHLIVTHYGFLKSISNNKNDQKTAILDSSESEKNNLTQPSKEISFPEPKKIIGQRLKLYPIKIIKTGTIENPRKLVIE